jgi:hypothetical protein
LSHGQLRLGFVLGAAIVTAAAPARALPTMIRLGYNDCASCHVSPQGGGLLTPYGHSIDKAQSLLGGDYQAAQDVVAGGPLRGMVHDLRAVLQGRYDWRDGQVASHQFRPRIIYRNATALGHGVRVSATVTADGERAPRPPRAYEPPVHTSSVFVNTALVQLRAGQGLEIAAGRDQLPSGINVPDLGAYIKSCNRLGYYDAPTQLKAHWWSKRHAFVPYGFGPAGNEAPGEREFGGGFLYEYDFAGNQRTVLGVGLLHGDAPNGSRAVLSAYARLGFGRWGLLAEHDFTDRTREVPEPVEFGQHASFAQLFWAVREWLVASAIGERLEVGGPFAQRLLAGRIEIAARLATQATVVVGAQLERNQLTGRSAHSLTLQLAVKTAR